MTATLSNRLPTPAARPVPWLGLQARLIANEAAKGLILMWRRRAMVVAFTLMNALMYLGFTFAVGGGEFVKPVMVLTLPALLALTVASTAALQGSGDIAEELNGGTMEQSQLSPASHGVRLVGRLVALAVEGLVPAAVLGIGFAGGFGLSFSFHPAVLIPAVLTIAAALGYGLLLAALVLRVASIGALVHVFNMAIIFFGGMMVPVTVFPDVIHTFARFVPTTLGVEATNTILAGQPLSATWTNGTLPLLIIHTIVLLTLGWAIYVAVIRRARREGGLSPR